MPDQRSRVLRSGDRVELAYRGYTRVATIVRKAHADDSWRVKVDGGPYLDVVAEHLRRLG